MKRFKITLSKKAFYSFVFLAMLLLAGLVYAAIEYGGRGTHDLNSGVIPFPVCQEGQFLKYDDSLDRFECCNTYGGINCVYAEFSNSTGLVTHSLDEIGRPPSGILMVSNGGWETFPDVPDCDENQYLHYDGNVFSCLNLSFCDWEGWQNWPTEIMDSPPYFDYEYEVYDVCGKAVGYRIRYCNNGKILATKDIYKCVEGTEFDNYSLYY